MSAEAEQAVARDLQRAGTYRFLSLLFTTPNAEVQRELTELSPQVLPSLRDEAAELGRTTSQALQGLYHQILGASGRVPDVECAYDDNTAGGRGPLIADVAGFYQAFSYQAPGPNTADHIGAELDFMGWLSLKRAFARHEGRTEQLEITEVARQKFLKDHLARWAIPFLERLAQVSVDTHYEAVSVLVSRTLRELEGDVFDRPNARMRLPVLDDPEDVESCG